MALKLAESVKNVTGTDYMSHLQTKPVTATISTSKSVKGKMVAESAGESKTLVPAVYTSGMSLTVSGGRTMNLGNYESARVDVSITVPCDKDSLEESYDFATDWVSTKIEEAVKLAKE